MCETLLQNTRTAAQRGLGLPEIREKILIFVDIYNLLRCQAVNSTFNTTIKSSETMKLIMFLEPNVTLSTDEPPVLNPFFSRSPNSDACTNICKCDSRIQGIKAIEYSFMFIQGEGWVIILLCQLWVDTELTLEKEILKDMLITQPPCEMCLLVELFRNHADGVGHFIKGTCMESRETVGELLARIKKSWALDQAKMPQT